MDGLTTGPFVMILARFTLAAGVGFAFWQNRGGPRKRDAGHRALAAAVGDDRTG